MKQLFYIVSFVLLAYHLSAQGGFFKAFPKSAVTAQFAGSTGLVTVGFSKVSPHDKLEVGLLYGYTPRTFGGNSAVVLKGTYNPLHMNITNVFRFEPLQTGLFVCQNFGDNLGLKWGDEYPRGYYWWSRSTRIHFFLGTQASYVIDSKHIDRLSVYFEANTNDLYVFSYVPNYKSIRLYDIFFFGTGVKVYIK